MKNFLRGAQLSFHQFRMFKQVFYVMWSITVVSVLVVPLLYTVVKTDSFQKNLFLSFYVGVIKIEMGSPESQVNVTRENGTVDRLRADVLVHHGPVRQEMLLIWEVIYDGISYTFYGLGSILFILLYHFMTKGRKHNTPSHVRGGQIIDAKSLRKQILSDNKKQKVKSYELAGIPYPAYTENVHTWIIGAPGCGKTQAISDLISQIRARGDRAIIYDKTGSYTKNFYNEDKDIIMNPLDTRSVGWSVFNDARCKADFDSMANSFMPEVKGQADPFWTNAAHVLFREACVSLHGSEGADNKTLMKKLLKNDLSEMARLVKGTPAQSLIDEQSPKTALSVMSVLSASLSSMEYLKDDADNSFSIRQWVEDEDRDGFLFVSSRGDQHATLKPLISAWLDIAVNGLLSLEQKRGRKVWIIMDELPSLQALPSLQQGLAESRQFGGAFVLGSQVYSQLESRYGTKDAAAIHGLCQTRMVFKANDYESARVGADCLGRSEMDEFKEGLSYGAHEMRDGVNLSSNRSLQNIVLPTEVMNLPDLTAFMRLGKDYPIAKVEMKYKEYPKVAEAYVLNEDYFLQNKKENKQSEEDTESDETENEEPSNNDDEEKSITDDKKEEKTQVIHHILDFDRE